MPDINGPDWLNELKNAALTTDPASDGQALAKTADDVAITPANLAALGATATFAGLIELATDAEAIAGSATDRAVTPANLQAKVAGAAAKGIVELATNAEALAGTDTERAVTPANLASVISCVVLWAFAGKNGAGACTLTGAKVGDLVQSVTGVAAGTVGNQASKFETTITVADQIQQSDAGNLSANIYLVRLLRKS